MVSIIIIPILQLGKLNQNDIMDFAKTYHSEVRGMFLVFQWLRLCAPNAGRLGPIPAWGTIEHVSTKDPECHNKNGTSHVPQLSPSSAKKKKKKRRDGLRPTLRCQKWHGFPLLSTVSHGLSTGSFAPLHSLPLANCSPALYLFSRSASHCS